MCMILIRWRRCSYVRWCVFCENRSNRKSSRCKMYWGRNHRYLGMWSRDRVRSNHEHDRKNDNLRYFHSKFGWGIVYHNKWYTLFYEWYGCWNERRSKKTYRKNTFMTSSTLTVRPYTQPHSSLGVCGIKKAPV